MAIGAEFPQVLPVKAEQNVNHSCSVRRNTRAKQAFPSAFFAKKTAELLAKWRDKGVTPQFFTGPVIFLLKKATIDDLP
ncbi:hypothetical protein H4S14_003892 [Agrobacterium vitis]|nr:hypothetical protein [Agrobacterium vitis]MBE1440121.1 hypothetical protein [Agrobacterium vitis]